MSAGSAGCDQDFHYTEYGLWLLVFGLCERRLDEDSSEGRLLKREILNKTPTPTSVTSTDEPPYEINGSGIPFAGKIDVTTLMLNSA
jgi:hypothetical protein